MQEHDLTVIEGQPKLALRITAQSILATREQIGLLQGMVKDLLLRDVDYGHIPGTPSDSLWDPGASQIISAFNCYPGQRRILKFEDTPEKISICLEVPIMSRETNQVVATGIGAASTLETKYKYRWVDSPKEWGYEDESIKGLKTKIDSGRTLYRIPNPEHSELFNTIVKMASKRAEVDAAESLPGVSSVLRQMFGGKAPIKKGGREEPIWDRFWGEIRRLGLTQREAHAKLGIPSMKDWLASGRSLDQALDILREGQADVKDSGEGTIPAEENGEPQQSLNREELIEELTMQLQEKMGWQPKTCEAWLMQNFRYGRVEEMPSDLIEEAVKKSRELVEKKPWENLLH
mgnify:CR=1 FL=1